MFDRFRPSLHQRHQTIHDKDPGGTGPDQVFCVDQLSQWTTQSSTTDNQLGKMLNNKCVYSSKERCKILLLFSETTAADGLYPPVSDASNSQSSWYDVNCVANSSHSSLSSDEIWKYNGPGLMWPGRYLLINLSKFLRMSFCRELTNPLTHSQTQCMLPLRRLQSFTHTTVYGSVYRLSKMIEPIKYQRWWWWW